MNYYTVKFQRERKDKPTDWMIRPKKRGGFELVYLGKRNNEV